ncbi:MAG: peptidylprolyl isomerase [Acidobacteriota bacterium]
MAKRFNNRTWRAGKIQRMTMLLLPLALSLLWDMPSGAFSKPVAKVNDTVLIEADLEQALNEIMPAGVFHGGFSSKKREKYRPQAFEKMIEKELFYQAAVIMGLKIDEEIIKAEREKTIKRQRTGREIAGATFGLPVKADSLFSLNFQSLESEELEEARRLTHILISVQPDASAEERKLKKAQAQEVIDRINAGEDMAVVAGNHSTGPYRVKGGDMGLVHRGRLHPDLEKEVFQLQPGRLSGIIETIYGYHVVRVEEVKEAEQLDLSDVYDKIKNELTERNEKHIREELAASLRAKARIEKYSN